MYCGLWLWAEVMELADAVAVARGTAVAASTGPLPPAYALAAATVDPSQAAEIQFASDATRQMARSMTRHGFDGG